MQESSLLSKEGADSLRDWTHYHRMNDNFNAHDFILKEDSGWKSIISNQCHNIIQFAFIKKTMK